MVVNIAVFASGNGSNFQAIAEAIERGEIKAQIKLVVTDQFQAGVIERAKKLGIAVLTVMPKNFPSKQLFEREILKKLHALQVEWLVLAGYMRLIGPTLLHAYNEHIVNIHPSLLPAFPGKDAIGQALEHGVKITGVTVHFVDEGMDTGRIINQTAVQVIDGNRERTEAAIHAVEHELYCRTLQQLFNK